MTKVLDDQIQIAMRHKDSFSEDTEDFESASMNVVKLEDRRINVNPQLQAGSSMLAGIVDRNRW